MERWLLQLGMALLCFCKCSAVMAEVKPFTNSIGMKFVAIPAGSFYMGSCILGAAIQEEYKNQVFMGLPANPPTCPSGGFPDSDAWDFEYPQHKVHISKGFMMGAYEVTLGQFKQFISGAQRSDLLDNDFIRLNNQGDNGAVTYVSWNDAQAFIRWLNQKEGKSYRLPTEAEWEYAARAGSSTRYSFGDDKAKLGQYGWYDDNSGKHVHEVGRLRPNIWGLYDMHGNVSEWCSDWYDQNYYQHSPETDPQGPSSGALRVDRGGGWNLSPRYLRSTFRHSCPPGYAMGLGFRLVLPVE